MLAPTLYEDDDILAVAKPAGMVVVPGRDEAPEMCLRQRLEQARREALWVVHRLDRDTSGVVLFARNAEAHRHLSMAFEHRRVDKTYVALTRGVPSPRDGVIEAALHTARKGKMRPALPGEPDALEASTAYAVKDAWATALGAVAYVEVKPRTGRQHQVRVHLRSIGSPLLVDPLYGRSDAVDGHALGVSPTVSVSRLTLHAAAIEVPRPRESGRLRVEAPLADDLTALIDALRSDSGHASKEHPERAPR